MEALPRVSDMLQYFNKTRYILWVVALLEACDVTKHGCHPGRHLGFHQELKIMQKPRALLVFCA